MLSALRSGVLRSVIQGQGAFNVRAFAAAVAAAPSSSAHAASSIVGSKPLQTYTKEERVEQWDYVNSIYFGPERDLKNFPNLVQPDGPPPTRLGVIPGSWFDFFYPKTGVTGPYLFGGGFVLWLLSKEILVIEHTFWELPSFIGAVWFINHQFGAKIRKSVEDTQKAYEVYAYTRPLSLMRKSEEADIEKNERLIEETETAKHLYQAKKEGVELQLEAAYRQRLLTAYQEVKKRLDYEVEKTNAKRRFEQDHMVNWIVSNVTKGITQQQEKESIQAGIRTLKNLAAKQSVA
jgi:F-type H+-transporting ATPase subunit b